MNYLKIIEIATDCEVKRQQINEYHRLLGANRQFDDETKEVFYTVIKDIEADLKKLQDKLKKLVQ